MSLYLIIIINNFLFNMNVIPKLNINKHPKDIDNLSLVYARNIKLTNDGSCLTNEEGITGNSVINDFLNSAYRNDKKIVGIIPCNKEIIFFLRNVDKKTLDIYRYNEDANQLQNIYKSYTLLNKYIYYNNGTIIGTFTYNAKNELIIIFSEYGGDKNTPMRTMNLGKFEDNGYFYDANLSENIFSLCPELKIPYVDNLKYINGNSYKGWYYLFIRYKINNFDYTQWFPIGFPIYVDTLNEQNLIKYCYKCNVDGTVEFTNNITKDIYNLNQGCTVGCSDQFSDETDIANESFSIDINHYNNFDSYKKFQIGFICVDKGNKRCYCSKDYNITNTISNFIFDMSYFSTYSESDLVKTYVNYYDVKNIINYKNKIYISNYKEDNLNDNKYNDAISKLNIILKNSVDYITSYKYQITIFCLDTVEDYKTISANSITVLSDLQNSFTAADLFKCSNDDIINTSNGDFYARDITIGRINSNSVPSYIEIAIQGKVYDNIILKFNNKIYEFEANKWIIQKGLDCILPNLSFNTRKSKSTLLPGEIYSFYIHFVDKYGNASNGYRLSNKTKTYIYNYVNSKWVADDSTEIFPLAVKRADNGKKFYIGIPINNNVIREKGVNDYEINIDLTNNIYNELIYVSPDTYNENSPSSGLRLNNYVITEEDKTQIKKYITETYSIFCNAKFINFKWYQIDNNVFTNQFNIFINSNNDRLYQVPNNLSFNNSEINYYNIIVKGISEEFINSIKEINPDIIGFYISYEKFEKTNLYTGILFNEKYNYFYCDNLDIEDEIKYGNLITCYNADFISNVNDEKYNYIMPTKYVINDKYLNKPTVYKYDTNTKTFPLTNIQLCVANSIQDNRYGLGTCFRIDDNITYDNKLCIIKKSNINIYTDYVKTLIKLGNILYFDDENINSKLDIDNGYNGYKTFNNFIKYNNKGLHINTTDFTAEKVINIPTFTKKTSDTDDEKVNISNNAKIKYYPDPIPSSTAKKQLEDYYEKFANYYQIPIYDDYFHESKCFNNKAINTVYEVNKELNVQLNNYGCVIDPANSIDVFKNKQTSNDNLCPKTYTNFIEENSYITEFNKTIRRSHIIQDESVENNWRKFDLEDYKNITENKGNIVNIVGIGNLLLVHTEHSLFQFSSDNTINANNKNISLTDIDIFDLTYREIITSELGFGGIKNKHNAILGIFGYIYYDIEYKRFFRYDNNNVEIMELSISEWLNNNNITDVKFANDITNNRLLIKFYCNNSGITNTYILSYNYRFNAFISIHDYDYDYCINTKKELYIIDDFNYNIYQFNKYDKNKRCIFENNNGAKNSIISIIVNESFNIIKILNTISYKISKLKDDNNFNIDNLFNSKFNIYSGYKLQITNELFDTGEIDISLNNIENINNVTNYDKPYYQLGNYNFNCIRDKFTKYKNKETDVIPDNMNNLRGNYFVISFIFNDNNIIEFEQLDYNISKQ